MARVCSGIAHDALVNIIEEELQYRGFKEPSIEKLVPYKSINGDGEIDLFVKTLPNYILLFEMKCSYSQKNRQKAKKQMKRAEENYFSRFSSSKRIFKFMVTYDKQEEDGYKIRWIPDKVYTLTPKSLNTRRTY